jgi:hypothetical protein
MWNEYRPGLVAWPGPSIPCGIARTECYACPSSYPPEADRTLCTKRMNVHPALHLHNISGNILTGQPYNSSDGRGLRARRQHGKQLRWRI